MESLEHFSVQLRSEGETQHSQITTMKRKLDEATDMRSVAEFKQMQASQDKEELQAEMEVLTQTIGQLRQ